MINDRNWSDIINNYKEYEDIGGVEIYKLVVYLNDIGYVAAGLKGGTSMHDLILSQSRSIHGIINYEANPRLRIIRFAAFDWSGRGDHWYGFKITYEDGSQKPWNVLVPTGQLINKVDHLLTKRLRWFKKY